MKTFAAALALAAVALAWSGAAREAAAAGGGGCGGTTITYTVDCWHAGICNLCGNVDYTCANCQASGCSPCAGFNNTCNFTDVLPACACVTQICVEIAGTDCNQFAGSCRTPAPRTPGCRRARRSTARR